MYEGYIWTAVSSNPQVANVSLDDQLASALQYADRFHVRVKGALVVDGDSRFIVLFHKAAEKVRGLHLTPEGIALAQRVGMQRLAKAGPQPGVSESFIYADFLHLAESGAFNVLFFLNRSRLGRRAALSIAVADTCKELGIKLFDMESPPSSLDIATSHDDDLLGAFKSVGFERDVRKLVDDNRKGMQFRAEKGFFGNRVTWGYKPIYSDGGKVVNYEMDLSVKRTMEEFASLYLARRSFQQIADRLNDLRQIAEGMNDPGYKPPRGDVWIKSKLQGLMDRIWFYAGYTEINKDSRTGRPHFRSKGIWEPMLSEDTVRSMLEEQASRYQSPRTISRTKLFSQCCYCGECGKRMHSTSAWWKSGKAGKHRYFRERYRCLDHKGVEKTTIVRRMLEFFADLENDEFRAALVTPNNPDRSTGIIRQIEICQQSIEQRKTGIARADTDYYIHSSGTTLDEERHRAIVGAAKKQIETMLSEITKLQDQLHAIEKENSRANRIEEIRSECLAKFNDPDVKVANAWLRSRFQIYIRNYDVERIVIL